MQKDFHHAVTYLVARLAGFPANEAQIVATSAQYVDDAATEGSIRFTDGTKFDFHASAHKDLDRRNFREMQNRKVWIPFHFLPGNNNTKEKSKLNKYIPYKKRLVCRKNSPVARRMMQEVCKMRQEPWALHLLGISLHVFVDTWAHQDFVGKISRHNNVRLLDKAYQPDLSSVGKLKRYFTENFDAAKGLFIRGVLPLGHAAALANPDLPYLKWAYMRKDEIHLRNNPEEFTEAVCQMFRWLKAYRADRHKPESEEMPNSLIEKFYHYFRFFESPSAELRHKWWCELIESGEFGINDCISYAEKGSESWLWAALGDTDLRKSKSLELEKPPYFNHTHWKLFHDALKVHRYQILHLVLPRFGIIEYL